MRRTLFIALLAVGLSAGPAAVGAQSPSPAPEALPRFEPVADCFVPAPEGTTADCGYISVPLFHDGSKPGQTKLGIMRLEAAQDTGAAPLFILAGGPGQANIDATIVPAYAQLLGDVLKTRDIVFLAQRGTEVTDTFLDCPDYWSTGARAFDEELDQAGASALGAQVLTACIDRFKGVDLGAFTTVENAADVNDVRVALGYDKIVYYGSSYGTMLGQFVMRQFPQILEEAVFDGTRPVANTSWSQFEAPGKQGGLDELTRLCEADAKCAAAYDIPALLDQAAALFTDGPVAVTIPDPYDESKTLDMTLTLDDLADFVNQLR